MGGSDVCVWSRLCVLTDLLCPVQAAGLIPSNLMGRELSSALQRGAPSAARGRQEPFAQGSSELGSSRAVFESCLFDPKQTHFSINNTALNHPGQPMEGHWQPCELHREQRSTEGKLRTAGRSGVGKVVLSAGPLISSLNKVVSLAAQ